jgi:diguanylate cyclase (GGDEF)-like protein/PAS domain S-box-containing protein
MELPVHQLDAAFLRRIVDSAPEGIAICDAQAVDHPVIYINAAFEQLTGYASVELLGSNLRMLQGADRDQDGRRRLRESIARGEECRVLLRNYRKNGELLWNEMYLQPLRNADGLLTHFVCFHRDASGRLKSSDRAPEGIPTWLREDRVTGLSSRPWFDELLLREWRVARREESALTLMLFDIDALGTYNDTYGRPGGDACLKRVARTIAGVFRRGSDVVGKWEDGRIAVLACRQDAATAANIVEHAAATVRKIAEMRIHHPRAPLQKYVTVTAGLATVLPGRDEESAQRLVSLASGALADAKLNSRGALKVAGTPDP